MYPSMLSKIGGGTDIISSGKDCHGTEVNTEGGSDDVNDMDYVSGDIDANPYENSSCSSSDDELSDALRKHREMIREMKKKHRVSATLLRRVRRRDLHHHQVQQHAYHAFLNDNYTSCCSESLSLAFEQLSAETSYFSLPMSSPPNTRHGERILSPSFPKTIDESSTTEQEFAWKDESIVEMDDEYNDEDFSILFRKKDKQPHPRTPQSRHKPTGLTGVREEEDDDGNDPEELFFDSLEVEENNEKTFAGQFFDGVPTWEKIKTPITTNTFVDDDEDECEAFVDSSHSVTQPSALPLEKGQYESIICSPPVVESTVEETWKNDVESFPDLQTMDQDTGKDLFQKNTANISFIETIDEDENDSFIDTHTESQKIDAETQIEGFAGPIVVAGEKDDNEDFAESFSDARSLEKGVDKDMFRNSTDHPSFIENIDEDKRERFVDICTESKVIDKGEEVLGNSAGPSIIENDEESENEDSVDSFSDAQFLEQEKDSFRNNTENTSYSKQIDGNQSRHFVDTFIESRDIDTKEEPMDLRIIEKENDNTVETFEKIQHIHHLDESGFGRIITSPSVEEDTDDKNLAEIYSKAQSLQHQIEEADNEAITDLHSKTQSLQQPIETTDNKTFVDIQSKTQYLQHLIEDLNHSSTIESIRGGQLLDLEYSVPQAQIPQHDEKESCKNVSSNPMLIEKEIEVEVIPLANSVLSQSLNSTISMRSQNLTENELSDSEAGSLLRKTLTRIILSQEESTTRTDIQKMSAVNATQKESTHPPSLNSECLENEEDALNNTLNPELLAEEDKQKIDNIFEEFLEAFDSMDSDALSNISQTKSVELNNDDSTTRVDALSQLNISEESWCMRIEPIEDDGQNRKSVSMLLQQESKIRLCRETEQIDIDVEVPTQIKNGVKEIDDMLDDFLRELAATDIGGHDDDEDLNCTEDYMSISPHDDEDLNYSEDYISASPQKSQFGSSTFTFEDSQRTPNAQRNAMISSIESDMLDCDQKYKSTEIPLVDESVKINSNLESDKNMKPDLGVVENDRAPKNRLETTKSPLHKSEGPFLTLSSIDDHSFSSDQSPIRPDLVEIGDSQSDFTSPSRVLSAKDTFRSKCESQIEHDANPPPNLNISSSFDSEIFKKKIKTDFVLPSFTPLTESRSRITSPELNHSLCDNSRIFLSTTTGTDSTRPIDPVATALSQDSFEDETIKQISNNTSPELISGITSPELNHSLCDNSGIFLSSTTATDSTRPIDPVAAALSSSKDAIGAVGKSVEQTYHFANISSKEIDHIASAQALSDDSTRPIDPVATALSRDSSENEMNTVEKRFRSLSNDTCDFATTSSAQKINDDSMRPSNPALTAFRDSLENETNTAEKSFRSLSDDSDFADKLSEAIDIVAPAQAIHHDDSIRPYNPVATTLSRESLKDEIDAVEKSLQISSNASDFANKLSEAINPGSPTQAIRNDDSENIRPPVDQGSVSTISASSLQLSYSVDSGDNLRKIPRKSLVEKKPTDDPDKSISISTPPPIPKKGSELTEMLGLSESKPPKAPLRATPKTPPRSTSIRSNPATIPFHRTRERLSEGSPGRQLRARSRIPSSPHRVETSRSPLYYDRGGDGRSSTGDRSVSWYTSPGRSRSSATSIRIQNSNSNNSTPNRNRNIPNLPHGSLPDGGSSKHIRSNVKSPLPRSNSNSNSKPPKNETNNRSPVRSLATQSTMVTYASSNRSMVSSMQSPLRGIYSLASPPRSPAMSLYSRMPKGARSAIRRMTNTAESDGDAASPTTHKDYLSIDTVRVCTNKFAYKIHPKNGPCDRCWALASDEERDSFNSRGSHLRIAKTRSGCLGSCTIFPPERERNAPVRLCRRCFLATHQQNGDDGCCRLQVYRGNHVRVRPSS